MTEPAPTSLDAIVSGLSSSQNLAEDAARAVDQAAQTAQAIAGEIEQAAPGIAPPPSSPLPPTAAQGSEVPEEMASGMPEGPASMLHKPPSKDLLRLLAIEVPVIVQLGRRRMTVSEVMRFAVGAIIEFSKSADEDLELLVNNKTIGKGHAVKVGENFGIKISAISPVKETIRKLGGAAV